jgi:fused signal recognition particle receptor
MRFFRKSKSQTADDEVPGQTSVTVAEESAAADEELIRQEIEEQTKQAVQRTRKGIFGQITGLFDRGSVDESLWEDLEDVLIAADAGFDTTQHILADVRERVGRDRIREPSLIREALQQKLVEVLKEPQGRGRLWPQVGAVRPAVILVLGVNGTGKTTTIGKLARAYMDDGLRVVIAAGDTFRAAAIEQLKEWGERVGADVIAHQPGADPAAVVFDALMAAESRSADVVIIDTAGRLHTKFNLMEELRKLRRVIRRKDESAPHEVLLVLDATTGQNGLIQAKAFTEAVDVTAVCLTKLDGTSKGGIVFAISSELGIPIRFVGTGEGATDLAPFSPEAFVEALFR